MNPKFGYLFIFIVTYFVTRWFWPLADSEGIIIGWMTLALGGSTLYWTALDFSRYLKWRRERQDHE